MKKGLMVVIMLFSITIIAQKKPKIKGNKDVVEIFNTIEGFNKIEVSDGLNIKLMQSASEGFRLKTDSNLIDVIRFNVIDSVLKINTTFKITSKKKLEIDVNFINLNKITLRNDAQIEGINKFNLNEISINSYDKSDFNLDIDTNNAVLNLNGNTNGKLQIRSDEGMMNLNDNSFLKGNLNIESLNLTVNKRSDMKLEGVIENLNLITTGSSDIKAKNLRVSQAVLNTSNTSDIYVYVSKRINIYAKGKSFIYIYGNPEIKVDGLNDKSQIIKR